MGTEGLVVTVPATGLLTASLRAVEEAYAGLSSFDHHRPVLTPVSDGREVQLDVRGLNHELQCPVCLSVMRETMTVMQCLHRFCSGCISKALRFGKKECPTCRVRCPSMRHVRPDPLFDALVAAVYPDLDEAEDEEAARIARASADLIRTRGREFTASAERALQRQHQQRQLYKHVKTQQQPGSTPPKRRRLDADAEDDSHADEPEPELMDSADPSSDEDSPGGDQEALEEEDEDDELAAAEDSDDAVVPDDDEDDDDSSAAEHRPSRSSRRPSRAQASGTGSGAGSGAGSGPGSGSSRKRPAATAKPPAPKPPRPPRRPAQSSRSKRPELPADPTAVLAAPELADAETGSFHHTQVPAPRKFINEAPYLPDWLSFQLLPLDPRASGLARPYVRLPRRTTVAQLSAVLLSPSAPAPPGAASVLGDAAFYQLRLFANGRELEGDMTLEAVDQTCWRDCERFLLYTRAPRSASAASATAQS